MKQWKQGDIIQDRYKIVGIAGAGGMGTVYEAQDVRLPGKRWALKRMGRPPGSEGCLQEAQLLMRLHHPCLPTVADYFEQEQGSEAVLVTEFIEGSTLGRYMERCGGVLSPASLLSAAMQLSGVLDYLHCQSPPIIHRDLKPSNVMVEAGEQMKLIDFGIARFFRFGAAADTQHLGTPGFAAPEQNGGGQTDARTDLYGFGGLIYYMATGRAYRPGPVGAQREQGVQAVRACMELHHRAWRQLPGLEELVCRLLFADPLQRPASAAEVREVLTDIWRQYMRLPEQAVSSSPSERGSAPGAAARGGGGYPRRAVIASVSSGSGATFLTLTLTKLLQQRQLACSAIEHPLLQPEWRALLAPQKPGAARAREQEAMALGYELHREGSINWHMLSSPSADPRDADIRFMQLLAQQPPQAELALIDVSARWRELEHTALLQEAEWVILVADPWLSKWMPDTLRRLKQLAELRHHRRLPTLWVANKELDFPRRSEWLAMLPEKPCAAVPLLEASRWTQSVWEGRWATDFSDWQALLERALAPLMNMLQSASNGGRAADAARKYRL